jgi:hypothetical protein
MRIAIIGLSLSFLALGACSSSSGGTGDSGTKPTGTTFTSVYKNQIEGYKCTMCHIPGGIGVTEGHLDMSTQATAYTNLVNVKAMGTACGSSGKTRVIPGNADDSLIIEKTEKKADGTPAPCGSEMPLGCGVTPGLGCLGDDDVTPLKSWINAGAMND